MTQRSLINFEGDKLLDAGKKDLMQLAEQIVGQVDFIDVTKFSAELAKFKLLVSELEDKFKDHLLTDIRKYSGSKMTAFGIEFSEMEGGIKYDYSQTESWVTIQDQIDKLKEKQKGIEAFCKSIKSKTTTVDEETGELADFYPPVKTSTTTIKKVIK
jgi:hypothetical protein